MSCASPLKPRTVRGRRQRKGAVLVLAALLMIVMMAFLAFSVDIGYMLSVQTELKRSTDAAALAGAGMLVEGSSAAELEAFAFLVRNPVGAKNLASCDDWEDHLADILAQNREDVAIEMGYWDPNAVDNPQTPQDERFCNYVEGNPAGPPSAIRVQAYRRDAPFFFGNLFRRYETVYDAQGLHRRAVPVDLKSESIARFQPRDIMLVLDFSGSMNDDSELSWIGAVPADQQAATRATIEANLQQIDNELRALATPPNCGNLPFAPAWPLMHGQAANGTIPHCTVQFGTDQYGYKSVAVTSTMALNNVVIEVTGGSRQTFSSLSGTSGTFKGTLTSTKNKQIVKVWVKSGTNSSPDGTNYGERFDLNATNVKKAFGLDTVAYPYPSGTWDTYISYADSSSVVSTAGYARKYGRMTLINYWLEQKAAYSQTPDLWRVSEQPIKQVKDGVGLFLQYIREVDTKDRMGLSIYDYTDTSAKLESGLTYDFDALATTTQHRQAGHYSSYTNIGAGIQTARLELKAHGRTGAFKMIVLMTDGQANRPTDEATGKAFALSEAQLVANERWPIVAISLGNAADTDLMQQIATMTHGAHFNVPGGQNITDYTAQLLEVFRRIADHRPLTLVK